MWTIWTANSNRCTPFAYFLSTWVFLLFNSNIHNIHKAPQPLIHAISAWVNPTQNRYPHHHPQDPQTALA
jgi:hypothetical protein